MWFGGDCSDSGNVFIALSKLFSDAVPSPRPPDGELWSTVPDNSPVLDLGHGCEAALSGAYISSALQDVLINGKKDYTMYAYV